MKRYLIYGAAAALACLLAPGEKTDVGALIPVELVSVYIKEESVCVETDTGDLGVGADLESAISDLKARAPGVIFLDTADYLVVTEETDTLIPDLQQYLRPSTEVCLGQGENAQAADFLAAHKPGVTLNDIRQGQRQVPVLTRTEERYHLERQENP